MQLLIERSGSPASGSRGAHDESVSPTTPPTSQTGGTFRLDGWLQQRCTG